VTSTRRRRRAPRSGAVAIIPAGGAGTRFGTRVPKQFVQVAGVPILAATVAHFARHGAVAAIVVAAPAAHLARTRRALASLARRKPITIVAGGADRQESVWRALQAAPAGRELVIVHDAVRPFIRAELIDRVLAAAAAGGAAVCALPIAETVKRVRDDVVEATVDRTGLWAVQTPQAFRLGLLREAHEKALRDGFVGTDEAMLVERLGHPVRVVAGLPENVKITTPADLRHGQDAGAERARRRQRGRR